MNAVMYTMGWMADLRWHQPLAIHCYLLGRLGNRAWNHCVHRQQGAGATPRVVNPGTLTLDNQDTRAVGLRGSCQDTEVGGSRLRHIGSKTTAQCMPTGVCWF